MSDPPSFHSVRPPFRVSRSSLSGMTCYSCRKLCLGACPSVPSRCPLSFHPSALKNSAFRFRPPPKRSDLTGLPPTASHCAPLRRSRRTAVYYPPRSKQACTGRGLYQPERHELDPAALGKFETEPALREKLQAKRYLTFPIVRQRRIF